MNSSALVALLLVIGLPIIPVVSSVASRAPGGGGGQPGLQGPLTAIAESTATIAARQDSPSLDAVVSALGEISKKLDALELTAEPKVEVAYTGPDTIKLDEGQATALREAFESLKALVHTHSPDGGGGTIPPHTYHEDLKKI